MGRTWTLPGQIAHWANEKPNRKAILEMDADGNWHSTTWSEYSDGS